MKIQIRSIHTTFLITFLLGCLALLQTPKAVAVVPAPDGGYPGANTAEGASALLNLTSGTYNTAVGLFSLRSNTTGSLNTGVGAGTLFASTGDQNTATGAGALFSNTTGSFNTANGVFALFSTTNGADANTANGYQALFSNTTGDDNTANGYQALFGNTDGVHNTGDGIFALFHNTTGSQNTALGYLAGNNVTTANNVICIGANVFGANNADSCYIGNISGKTVPSGIPVFVNSDNLLGTVTSSKRFKEDIKPMDKASEAVFSLQPVAFRYKKEIDPERTGQLGLVAEDVEKVNPDLVVRDKEGKPYSVRYDQVNAMLLNEFLKEHRAFVEEQRKIAQQQTEIDALKAELKEQRSLIQKVSDRVEMKKSMTQIVSKP